jgi:hypothetical protein
MPRGLGLATATTSAAFFPHCEQRIRCASLNAYVWIAKNPPRRPGCKSMNRSGTAEMPGVPKHRLATTQIDLTYIGEIPVGFGVPARSTVDMHGVTSDGK